MPSDCHNAIGIVFLPVHRAITGSIEPIANSSIVNGQGSVSSLLWDDAFKDFLTEGNINAVLVCNFLAASSDAVRLIAGLLVVVFYIIMSGFKRIDHSIFSVVFAHIHDKVDCRFSV